MKELELDMIMINPITPFPGTPLYDEAVEKGWNLEDFRWEKWEISPVMNTPDMTIDEIQELLDESYRFFYNDIGYFLFGKKLLRILFNPNFWWYRYVTLSFLTIGFSKFLIKMK